MRTSFFTLASIATIAMSAPVSAQDQFTGFYAGAGLGLGFHEEGGFDEFEATINGSDALEADAAVEFTVLAGYTTAMGDWIVGAEAELAFHEVDFFENACVDFDSLSLGNLDVDCADAGLVGDRGTTLRLRGLAGRAISDSTLLFATGGLSAADVSFIGTHVATTGGGMIALQTSSFLTGDSPTAFGFNLGVGAEHQVGNGWSLRGHVAFERLFATSLFTGDANTGLAGNSASISFDSGDTIHFDNLSFGFSVVRRF